MAMRRIPQRVIGRRRVVNRVEELVRRCAGKRVLHLGCADFPFTDQSDGRLLHAQLARVARELWGMDRSPEGLASLRAMGWTNVLVGDAEALEALALPGDFDVIVAGELIEHLENPGRFLASIRALMTPATDLVLTTPNASSLRGVVHALGGREKVHHEHCCYFSYFTIAQLLARAGLRVVEACFYQEVASAGLPAVIDRALSLGPALWPALADGLVVRAVRADEGDGHG